MSVRISVRVLFFLILCLLQRSLVCEASKQAVHVSSNGFVDDSSSQDIMEIVSPSDQHEFETSSVPVKGQLHVWDGISRKICWKLVSDRVCLMKQDAIHEETLDTLTQEEPYNGCAAPPIDGKLVLNAGCWILRFDLLVLSEENHPRVMETQYRRIEVVTVDEMVKSIYPHVPHRSEGGRIGMIHRAVRLSGMGMTLQFQMGDFEAMQTAAEVTAFADKIKKEMAVQSFVSVWGLPEKWRDGFDVGAFSYNGSVPSDTKRTLKSRNVELHDGDFNETLHPFLESNPDAPIGLLLIDLFVNSTTTTVLDEVACRLAEGSIVSFGSYFNYPKWAETVGGERAAWLAAVDRWGIHFTSIGFYATHLLVRIDGTPEKCLGHHETDVDEADSVVKTWAKAKVIHAREMADSNQDAMIAELEEVIAVDPQNGEALGLLAFGLEDIHRISERFSYAIRALAVQHKMPQQDMDAVSMLKSLQKYPMYEAPFDRNVRLHRLYHDLEQLKYLSKRDRLPRELAESAIAAYEEVLAQFSQASMDQSVTLSWNQWKKVGPYFNRALYIPTLSRIAGGALNSAVDYTEVLERYNESDPHVVVVDDFLSEEALTGLLRYYREATIYYDAGLMHLSYLGTYLPDGFGNPLLGQVVEELAQKLQPILCDRPLVQAWVYKYDDTLQRGINIHADTAAVNVNLWLTENWSTEADHGGLVLFTEKAPEDWGFDMYNTDPTPPKVMSMLEQSGFKNITVPYKQNRIVIFDSMLFHVSDITGWQPGYEKRRINLTLLFGRARTTCDA